ncbi:MAG: hypothetical protein K2X93_25925 [Candidatus Obscuribacterales bacterium]|nr:hypothetical protein [Candidatus Obscuribacterales bacterium]
MFKHRSTFVKIYAVTLATLLTVINLLGTVRAGAAATADWQTEGRKAYLSVRYKSNVAKGYQHYQRARRLCTFPPAHPISLDLDMCMVHTLLIMNRIDEAQSILLQIGPVIERLYRGELLELRYWRRLKDLHGRQGLFRQAARDQRHVVDIISKELGEDCTDAMDERINLLRCLAISKDWKLFLDTIQECDRIMSTRPHEQQTARINGEIEMYNRLFHDCFHQAILKDPHTALGLIDRYEEIRPVDRRLLTLMIKTLAEQPNLAALRKRIVAIVRKNKWSDNEARRTIAQIEIGDNVPKAFEVPLPDKKMVEDIEEAYRIAQQIVPPDERHNNDLYMQALALKATLLAKTGHPEQADALLDSYHSTASIVHLLGILQARREIAIEAIAQKKTALAEKQFADNIKLSTRTTSIDRANYIHQWMDQRRKYLGH